jgi:acetylglutamate kinase
MYKGRTFVVKVGGSVLRDPMVLDGFVEQIGLLHQLNIDVVVVHGGGPQVTELSAKLGIAVEMVNGRRVTKPETLEVVKMVLNGTVNTDLLAALSKHEIPAVGLSGVDAGLITAVRRPVGPIRDSATGVMRDVDFGLVGDIVAVNVTVLRHLLQGSYMPVVSALAVGEDGTVYNVNADTIAARLGGALKAEKLMFLTDVPGVLRDKADPQSLISHLTSTGVDRLLADGISGGMRAKLEACRDALDHGVRRAHIISGVKPDSILIEVFTNEGSGTLVDDSGGASQEELALRG